MRSVERMTRQRNPALHARCPAPHVWAWFNELLRPAYLQRGEMPPEQLTWTELNAWATATGRVLRRWEAVALRELAQARFLFLCDYQLRSAVE